MDIDLDTGRLVVFLTGITFFVLAEQLMKARTPTGPTIHRIALHAGVAVLNTVMVRVLTYVPLLLWIVYIEQMGWGLARWLGLYGLPEFILSIIVLDLFDYFWHRANHRIPMLWRFHKAHHADNDMDVFTALRFHPGELLISSGVKAVWVLIWGPSAFAWFLFEVLVSLCAQMHHSNVDLPDNIERYLSKVLVTPRFHATHHMVDRRYGDQNFSTIFSCWDLLFNSQAPALPAAEIKLQSMGLPEGRNETLSIKELLLEPFRKRNLNLTLEQAKLSD